MVAGEYHTESMDFGEAKTDVEEHFFHPDYNTVDKTNDICLLKLKNSLEYGKSLNGKAIILPACLPTVGSQPKRGTKCFVAGWGLQNENDGYYRGRLRSVIIHNFNRHIE